MLVWLWSILLLATSLVELSTFVASSWLMGLPVYSLFFVLFFVVMFVFPKGKYDILRKNVRVFAELSLGVMAISSVLIFVSPHAFSQFPIFWLCAAVDEGLMLVMIYALTARK